MPPLAGNDVNNGKECYAACTEIVTLSQLQEDSI